MEIGRNCCLKYRDRGAVERGKEKKEKKKEEEEGDRSRGKIR
jgi:hypothetical protein